MARAKVKGNVAGKMQGGFIECELDEEQRGACRMWLGDGTIVVESLQQLIDEKYTLKAGYDRTNECYVAYISGHWQMNKPDKDWTLTGRGSTAWKAIGQALYKHFEVLNGDWSEWKTTPARETNWD